MLLQPGSTGADVGRLEARLRELGLYTGSADNIYGGGVEGAVKAFQMSNGLPPSGAVDDATWTALFPGTAAAPAVNPPANATLAQRCLALTGAFETSAGPPDCYAGLAGDFDGQGLSFGALQCNIGQGTLQPLLAEMIAAHTDAMTGVFQSKLDDIRTMLASPLAAQLAWARGIQDPAHHTILEPWKGMLMALGHTLEFQAIEVGHAVSYYAGGLQLCARFGVSTERAVALMFDIRVQNGSIGAATEADIRTDFAAIPDGTAPLDAEIAKLRSIANRRADASGRFAADVRDRKLTIANGTGTVHGLSYDLERQYGIRLVNAIGV